MPVLKNRAVNANPRPCPQPTIKKSVVENIQPSGEYIPQKKIQNLTKKQFSAGSNINEQKEKNSIYQR